MAKPKTKEFYSIAEFAEYANRTPANAYSRTYEKDSFCPSDFDTALQDATTGNPEYVRDIFAGAEVMSQDVSDEISGYHRDVEGQFFDVADVMSGEPEHWWAEDHAPARKVIRITAMIGMSCNAETSDINNRGAAIVSLCDEFQKQGAIVELTLVKAVIYNGRKYIATIHVPTNPLDIDAVAFAVANPAANRRLGFAYLEVESGKRNCLSYGQTTSCVEDGQDFIFPPIMHHGGNWLTLDTAKRRVLYGLRTHNANPGTPVIM
jgi:hypothetical protein